jgi:hypothetical protein
LPIWVTSVVAAFIAAMLALMVAIVAVVVAAAVAFGVVSAVLVNTIRTAVAGGSALTLPCLQIKKRNKNVYRMGLLRTSRTSRCQSHIKTFFFVTKIGDYFP